MTPRAAEIHKPARYYANVNYIKSPDLHQAGACYDRTPQRTVVRFKSYTPVAVRLEYIQM